MIVVGSQAILGSFDENDLPEAATMSLEVDVLPVASMWFSTTSRCESGSGTAEGLPTGHSLQQPRCRDNDTALGAVGPDGLDVPLPRGYGAAGAGEGNPRSLR